MTDRLLGALARLFYEDKTARSFVAQARNGSYVAATRAMVREIERLRGRFKYIADLEDEEGMTDAKFAEIVLQMANSEISVCKTGETDA